MTRSIKARFYQVGDQVSQVKDQVGQSQGQELDNNLQISYLVQIKFLNIKIHIFQFLFPEFLSAMLLISDLLTLFNL